MPKEYSPQLKATTEEAEPSEGSKEWDKISTQLFRMTIKFS